jgi:hypothetical protein
LAANAARSSTIAVTTSPRDVSFHAPLYGREFFSRSIMKRIKKAVHLFVVCSSVVLLLINPASACRLFGGRRSCCPCTVTCGPSATCGPTACEPIAPDAAAPPFADLPPAAPIPIAQQNPTEPVAPAPTVLIEQPPPPPVVAAEATVANNPDPPVETPIPEPQPESKPEVKPEPARATPPPAPETPAPPPPAAPEPPKPSTTDPDDPFAPLPPAKPRSATTDSDLGMRDWTDDSGQYRIQARLVLIVEGKVRLLKQTGRTTTVPLDRLSTADRAYVAQMIAQYGPDLGQQPQLAVR